MDELSRTLREMAECLGAVASGIATTKTLEGGPPSTDLTYVLPDARAALCFALALDQNLIEPYLKKEDHRSFELNYIRTSTLASGISLEIADFLEQKGYTSVPLAANLVYRKDTKHGPYDEKPPIAHRYLAVRSGVGRFGLSGNVLRAKEGAAIILGSVVTAADLVPTEPLPEEQNYCDECRMCVASCPSGFMSPDEKTTVTLGGVEFVYSKRRHHLRCDYVCGGFTGLHPSGKWSTWSPGRFPIPEQDHEFKAALAKAAKAYCKRPRPVEGFFNFIMPGGKLEYTCGHCQLVCHPNKAVRARRHKMLIESGVVVQNPNGSREAVSPDAAIQRIAAMTPEIRALYEDAAK